MAESEAVRQAFHRVEPVLAEVQRYVRETLQRYCDKRGYLFTDRVKQPSSLEEKLDGGRFAAWSKVDDLYGCTIVVPTAHHEEAVVRKLDASFEPERFLDRSTAKKGPDVFRFDGARWYGRLKDDLAGDRQPGTTELLFEVQVVTAFEYAWMAVTHDLVYKGDNVDWRRLRLAAQLKAAVEQVEVLIAAFDSASGAIQESPWPETTAKASIVDYFKTLASDGLIPDNLLPSSWRRFADNVFSLVRSYETDAYRMEKSVRLLLETIDADLRGATPTDLPVSGTLFQYVVSVVAREDTEGDLSRFTVVPSRELTDFYNVKNLPRPFVFDGQSVVQSASAQGSLSEAETAPSGPPIDGESEDARLSGDLDDARQPKPVPAAEATRAVRNEPPANKKSGAKRKSAAKKPPAARK